MYIAVCSIGIVFMILSTASLGTVGAVDQKISHTVIKVAIEDSRELIGEGWGVPKETWDHSINYSWTVNNRQYTIQTTGTDLTVLEHYDELDYYDVLVMSGMHDEHLFLGARPIFRFIGNMILCWRDENVVGGVKYTSVDADLIRRNLLRFVNESNKGFVGHCSGSVLPLRQYNDEITTFAEKLVHFNEFLNKSYTRVRALARIGLPILDEHYSYDNPIRNFIKKPRGDSQAIGQMAYLYYSGSDMENESHHFGGFPVDLIVRDTSHPILNGYFGDTLTAYYGAGPALYVPADDTNVTRLLDYPDDIGDDQWTKVIAWRFPFIQGTSICRTCRIVRDRPMTIPSLILVCSLELMSPGATGMSG